MQTRYVAQDFGFVRLRPAGFGERPGMTDHFDSRSSAAAGVIILLIWVYYAAMIFLLGAEFTQVWAHHYGSSNLRED